MNKECKFESIFFTVITFDEVHGCEMLIPLVITKHEPPSQFGQLLEERLLNDFRVPLMEREVRQDDLLLRVIFKVNFLLKNS